MIALSAFSPAMVIDMSERLCIEAGIVKNQSEYQARLERKEAEASCHLGIIGLAVSSEQSTEIIPPSDLQIDMSSEYFLLL